MNPNLISPTPKKTHTLIFAFLGLSLIVIVSIFSYWAASSYKESSHWRDHSNQVMAQMYDLAVAIERAETSQRAYIITQHTPFLDKLEESERKMSQDSAELKRLVSDNPKQSQLVQELEALVRDRMAYLKIPLDFAKAHHLQKAIAHIREGKGSAAMNKVRAKIQDIEQTEKQLLTERTSTAERDFERAGAFFLTGQILAFVLLLSVTILLRAEILRRSRIEAELISANSRALEASALKSQFLANMSHEIRTPLNGIIGMTKVLSDTSLQREQKEFVEIIRDSSNSLLSLINGILDLSKIESGKLQLEEVHFELRSLVDSTVSMMNYSAVANSLQIVVQIEDNVPNFLLGDPLRVRQILINLLNNSIKFSNNGKVQLKIKLLEEANSCARLFFEIIDQGIGIDAETKTKLFQSFSQGDESTTRRYGGTGLGLAITRQLIEMMGGKIDVESSIGQGSRFYFDVSFRAVKYAVHSLEQHRKAIQEASFQGRILVAEDNQTNQKVAAAMLKQMGHTFKIVSNGLEAIEALKAESFDIILMDAQMPVMDGYETTRRIRKGEAGEMKKSLPILAVTANAIKGDLELCLEAGMNDYVSKPISQSDLQLKISNWLKTGISPIDYEVIRRLHDLEDEENLTLVADVIQIFIQSGAEAVRNMKELFEQKSFADLKLQAHSFKSTCNNVGAIRASQIAARIEKFQAEDDLTMLAKLIDALDQEHQTASEELMKYDAA